MHERYGAHGHVKEVLPQPIALEVASVDTAPTKNLEQISRRYEDPLPAKVRREPADTFLTEAEAERVGALRPDKMIAFFKNSRARIDELEFGGGISAKQAKNGRADKKDSFACDGARHELLGRECRLKAEKGRGLCPPFGCERKKNVVPV